MISSHDNLRVVALVVSGSCTVADDGHHKPKEQKVTEYYAQNDADYSSGGWASVDAGVGCGEVGYVSLSSQQRR